MLLVTLCLLSGSKGTEMWTEANRDFIGNRSRGHSWDILAENLAAFCPCPEIGVRFKANLCGSHIQCGCCLLNMSRIYLPLSISSVTALHQVSMRFT